MNLLIIKKDEQNWLNQLRMQFFMKIIKTKNKKQEMKNGLNYNVP